jgi:alpha-galactosidase
MLLVGTTPLLAGGQVQDLPGNWVPTGLRRVSVAGVKGSSTFAPESGQYAPARAIDGNRGTKWVARVAPSPAAPQWITLELFGTQEISAVAVFGERVDNDGIRDAQVQVAGLQAGEFTTVAALQDARSSRWLATFVPVKTRAVRLLITRSGGPTTHTDVYEIELYGRPLPVAELKEYAAERVGGCSAQFKQITATADRLRLKTDPQRAILRDAVDAIVKQHLPLVGRFARWDALSQADRSALAVELERQEVRIHRLVPALERAAVVWPGRTRELEMARQRARAAATGEKVIFTREGNRVRLGNNRVSVILDETEGDWEATWLGQVEAAVRRVRFAVEANGRVLAPRAVKAEAVPLTDARGSGLEIRQRWGKQIEVERGIHIDHGRPAVVVSGRITNHTDRDVTLGSARMVDLSQNDRGWWHLGSILRAPAAIGYAGASPACRPAPDEETLSEAGPQYGSAELLALAPRDSPGGLAIGALSARQGSSSVSARFQVGEGGTALAATLNLRGKVLPPGATIALDPVWLSFEDNHSDALEHYGDAVALTAAQPVRTGANALWCSWYPIRMGISEEIVLAHAAIAARHFQPLGLDVIQLDHGWQRGDICGDWFPNERFPHGMKWLSEQLRSRHGLKLGLWIAPTQVALTSRLFRDHPDWMRKNAQGKPAVSGRWFWVPNPEMTVLDASHPAAEKWIEKTFARLSAEGASYYKIDFIAGSPALARAMAAIRRGAGPKAWIRYCQTPALLSAGLANSAYIGIDTGDAGLRDGINLLRDNAPLLAASYWVNDRLYHREVCDMSVGMKADVEEARFRLTLMTLSGCSISFSDDFRPLQLPRIRMMQQCLPPGNPTARPLDLFERERPSLWHMHCKNSAGEWDAVGIFNFEDQPQERTVDFRSLGLPPGAEATVFEFWEEKYLGCHSGRVTLSLPPRTARLLLIRRLPDRPDVIATNMHVLGGYHEIKRLAWDDRRCMLAGTYQRAPGLEGKAFLYVPARFRPQTDSLSGKGSLRISKIGPNVWVQEIRFKEAQVDWAIRFEVATP